MRLLVSFRDTATEAEIAGAVHSVGGWIETAIPALHVVRIVLPGDAEDAFGDGDAVAAVLSRHPAVARAEFDSSVHLAFDPNDQYYANDPYVNLGQWGLRKAFVDKAWDLARGAPGVSVAILDTGVDPNHPDLAGAIVPGTTLVSQPSSECTPGSTTDDNSHGTHVAGVVGASGNNGLGIAGVAFGAKVMPLKVLDCTGIGALSDVAQGIVYAVDHGARVVNLSLGSPFDSPTLRAAVTYAAGKNVLIVSAAGNCGTSADRCTSVDQVEYPAAYPEVLSVGATDTDDSVALFSTRNATVDVAAPGRRIVSTTPTYDTYLSKRRTDPATKTYAAFSGTSQASPFVAGLAALILSAEPTLTAAQVLQRIESTADDFGTPGRDDAYGFGRVNAQRAIATSAERFAATYDTSALPKSVATGRSFEARVAVTNASSFTWRAADPGAVRLVWTWSTSSGAAVPGATGTIALPADVGSGATATVAGTITAPATAGTYTLRLDLDRGGTLFSSRGAGVASLAVNVGSGFGATYAPAAGAANFDAGATTQLAITLTNAGTQTWPAAGPSPVRLSYHWIQNSAAVVWDGQRAVLPADVLAGAKVTLTLPVLTPSTPGQYTLRVDLVQEGVAWFSGIGVAPLDLTANVHSAYVATYAVAAPPVLLPGGRATVPITVTNSGTVAWTAQGAGPVRLASHVNDRAGNVVIWDGARTQFASDIAPGASAKLDLIVDAPSTPGPYRVRVDLVREGIAWFSGLGVATGDLDLIVAGDFRAQLPTGPLAVSQASPLAQLQITNTSIATWTTGGSGPVNVSVHWYDASGALLVWDGPRTPLGRAVAPNETVAITVRLGPPPAGAAFARIDLVAEGIAWFGAGSLRPVTLVP